MAEKSFHPADYVVFGLMLLISAGIGIYHGCTGGKQRTTSEYLLGDRSMKTMPISISLLVSFLSAITLLGVPSEIFTYGAEYMVVLFSYILLIAIAAIIFAPIFHGLRLTSVHEVILYFCDVKWEYMRMYINSIYKTAYRRYSIPLPLKVSFRRVG